MVTSPGFSSRSTAQTFQQFPQRDEAVMSDLQPGFSNSDPADESTEISLKVLKTDEVEDKAIKPEVATTKKRSSQKR